MEASRWHIVLVTAAAVDLAEAADPGVRPQGLSLLVVYNF